MYPLKWRLIAAVTFSFLAITVFFSNCAKVDFEETPTPTISAAIKEVCYDSYSTGEGTSSVAGGCVPAELRSCEGGGELATGQVACWGWHDQGADGNAKDFDPRMCRSTEGYKTVKDGHGNEICGEFSTGCVISASKCSSGQAIATQLLTNGESCYQEVWVYECL